MTTNIALISDVHGNQTALEAVVADIKKQAIDESWFLGDLVGPGPGTDTLFNLLDSINTTHFMIGNWDLDCFLNYLNPAAQIDLNDPMRIYLGILSKYIYKHIQSKNIEKLKEYRLNEIIHLNHLKISLSHNLPDKVGGPELISNANTAAFNPLFKAKQPDIAIYGHIHHQVLRYSENDQLIINPGSVGEPFFNYQPLNHDRRAQYVILKIDAIGMADVTFKKVIYNQATELKRAEAADLPYFDLYQDLLINGISHTHDDQLLKQLADQNDYLSEVRTFMNIHR